MVEPAVPSDSVGGATADGTAVEGVRLGESRGGLSVAASDAGVDAVGDGRSVEVPRPVAAVLCLLSLAPPPMAAPPMRLAPCAEGMPAPPAARDGDELPAHDCRSPAMPQAWDGDGGSLPVALHGETGRSITAAVAPVAESGPFRRLVAATAWPTVLMRCGRAVWAMGLRGDAGDSGDAGDAGM